MEDQGHQNEELLDEYIFDLDQGDMDMEGLLTEKESPSSYKGIIMYPLGQEMFSPHNIRHPRNAKWWSQDHVGKFIRRWIRNPLEKEARNILIAEYSRPVNQEKVCLIPNLDP